MNKFILSMVLGTSVGFNATMNNTAMFTIRSDAFIKETALAYEKYYKEQEELKRVEEQRAKEIEAERIRVANVKYNPYDITEISNIRHDELYNILSGTGIEDITSALILAEQEYDINAFILAGIIALESNWGKSQKAQEYNNLGGVAVYSNTTRGAVYSSRYESVIHMAEFLKRDYLTVDGVYHVGYSVWDVNKYYCVSNTWADKVITIAEQLYCKY